MDSLTKVIDDVNKVTQTETDVVRNYLVELESKITSDIPAVVSGEKLDDAVYAIQRARVFSKKFSQLSVLLDSKCNELEQRIKTEIIAAKATGDETIKVEGRETNAIVTFTEATKTLRDATDEDYNTLEEYVKMDVKTEYKWDKNAIKKALRGGAKFDFAKLIENQNINFKVLGESK